MPILHTEGFLPLYTWPEPVLATRCKEVDVKDPATQKWLLPLLNSMVKTMRRHNGIGLAANQVGLEWRLLVAHVPGLKPIALVNPAIIWHSDESRPMIEGCLSFPGQQELVTRWTRVKVQHTDPITGESLIMDTEHRVLLAQVFQHEIEHLNGLNFLKEKLP